MLGSKGTVDLSHFVGGAGLVLFQEGDQAARSLSELKGHDIGASTVDTRLPSPAEEDLVQKLVKVKRVEELMSLLGLSGNLPRGGGNQAAVQQTAQSSVSSAAPAMTTQAPTSMTAPATQASPAPGQVAQSQAAGHFLPKLPYFSGSQEKKDDASFELWAFEIRSLIQEGTHSPAALAQAVRRNLRGTASHVLLHLGQGVSVHDILQRL